MKFVLFGLVAALAATSLHLGFLLGTSDDWAADATPIAISVIAALLEFAGVVLFEPWLMKKEQRSARKFDADRALFQGVINEVPEEIMAYLSSACADAVIHHDAVFVLCGFEEDYGGKVMKRFHCRKMQRKFEKFYRSLGKYIEFTSVHLFPLEGTSGLSLRQGTETGIEHKDRAELQRRVERYDVCCKEMIDAYRSLVECGKRYFGC